LKDIPECTGNGAKSVEIPPREYKLEITWMAEHRAKNTDVTRKQRWREGGRKRRGEGRKGTGEGFALILMARKVKSFF